MTRKDLKVQIWPISGWIATITAMSVPPAAASAAANPKVMRWMRPTLIPHTIATSRLCEVARMALPSFVLRRKTNTAAVMTAAKTKATRRDFDSANGPTTKEPVRNSTAEVGGEGELGQVDDGDRDAEGQEQRGQLGRVDHPEDQRSFEQHADE